MSKRWNPPIFILTIFLVGRDNPINENYDDADSMLDSLEMWLKVPNFWSAHVYAE